MRIVVVFLLMAVVVTAQTSSTLRQKYGQPTSQTVDRQPTEIYKVRPEIKLIARYTKRGDVCSMFIAPLAETTDGKPSLLKSQRLEEVIDELVPENQRGAYVMGTFLDIICLPRNDCWGSRKDYKQVSITYNGGVDAYRFAAIEWKHRKCQASAATKRNGLNHELD